VYISDLIEVDCVVLKKITLVFAGAFLGLLAYFTLAFYFHQEVILFKSEPLAQEYHFTSPHVFQEIFLTSKDDASIHALLYKSPLTPKGCILYFHGRGGNLARYWNAIPNTFLTRGYDVLIMDYRGFGKSYGKLSEKALLNDAELLYHYAIKCYPAQNLILYGRSLGTGIATYIASKHLSKMLILEAPYLSILALAEMKFSRIPKWFLSAFVKYHLRADQWIQKVKTPIELFHGTRDRLIPYENSQHLYTLTYSKNPLIRLNTIFGGTHNNLSHHPTYQERLDSLLR
jgi:alpha-beta hydrolase superfamily lysophospholipase